MVIAAAISQRIKSCPLASSPWARSPPTSPCWTCVNRCDRRGRLIATRLIVEHGADLPMPAIRQIVAADCPRMQAGHLHDVCGVHFPLLSGLAL